MPDEDPVPYEVLKMPDQHSLGYLRNAPTQFTGAQWTIGKAPQNRPFHRPSTTDSMASIGQADTSFFDTGMFLLSAC
jgi:hypothetical protein